MYIYIYIIILKCDNFCLVVFQSSANKITFHSYCYVNNTSILIYFFNYSNKMLFVLSKAYWLLDQQPTEKRPFWSSYLAQKPTTFAQTGTSWALRPTNDDGLTYVHVVLVGSICCQLLIRGHPSRRCLCVLLHSEITLMPCLFLSTKNQ